MKNLIGRADAVAQGYTVDDHGPGRPIAFKGRRFAPSAVVGVFTHHETELRAALHTIATASTTMPAEDLREYAQRTLDRVPS